MQILLHCSFSLEVSSCRLLSFSIVYTSLYYYTYYILFALAGVNVLASSQSQQELINYANSAEGNLGRCKEELWVNQTFYDFYNRYTIDTNVPKNRSILTSPVAGVSSSRVTMQNRLTLALNTVNSTKIALVYASSHLLLKRYAIVL